MSFILARSYRLVYVLILSVSTPNSLEDMGRGSETQQLFQAVKKLNLYIDALNS